MSMSPFLLKLSTHPGCRMTLLLAFVLTKTIHVGGLSIQYMYILPTYFSVQRSIVWIYHNVFNHLNRTLMFFSSFCYHKQGHNDKNPHLNLFQVYNTLVGSFWYTDHISKWTSNSSLMIHLRDSTEDRQSLGILSLAFVSSNPGITSPVTLDEFLSPQFPMCKKWKARPLPLPPLSPDCHKHPVNKRHKKLGTQ